MCLLLFVPSFKERGVGGKGEERRGGSGREKERGSGKGEGEDGKGGRE